uniref:Uncharacterized protein n=1 Tax=Anguilla anguilla TaxID=7936 RepID=A0A0E9TY10_ANGAN
MNKLPFYALASTLHILQETTSTLQRGVKSLAYDW